MPDFIDLHGTRTAFEAQGSGPPLLMLHGAEGSRRQFNAIRPALVDRYTVITYDQRDCGDTENPDAPATLATLANDAQALLEALGQRSAFVFGTSFGGRVAQALALRQPAAVRRLVLASTWPLPVSLATANAEVAQQLAQLRARLPDSAEQVAERAGISRSTLHLIESGAPGTSLGKLLQVLVVLGMESDLSGIAADDLLGRKLEDARLTETRRRAPKRSANP